MATTIATITLSSSTLLTDSLNLSVAMTVTGSDTTGIARTKAGGAKANASNALLYTAADFATEGYMYIKNVDADLAITVWADTTTDNPDVIKLKAGEWAFIPIAVGTTYKAYPTLGSGTPYIEWLVYGTE